MALTIALLVGLATLSPTASAQSDRDCADFPNQAAAQDYFIQRGGPSSDPDRLDGDRDGQACDALPCPCSTGAPTPAPTPRPALPKRPNFLARVSKVIDGDTLKVRSRSGHRYKVRLIGIDTPEVFGAAECGGRQASARMKRLARRGRNVRVTGDPTQPTRDRYGRLLAYVKTATVQLNASQVRAGWAKVYVVGYPFQRLGSFVAAQRAAAAARRGVWGTCGGDFDRRI